MARPRIQIGKLVYSTDKKQASCIRVLTILHYYKKFSCVRVKRKVVDND